MPLTISFEDDSFFFTVGHDSKSLFDEQIQEIWTNKMTEGHFRYRLGGLPTICLGNYRFIVQLNEERAVNRRTPQFITDVAMKFDPEEFHFGKVNEKEIICYIEPLHWPVIKQLSKHVLMINVSPLGYCHSLLVPSIDKSLPQVLKKDEFRLAVELMLKSQNSALRIGFNSLGAHASVNNLHLHLFYLKERLFLENAPTHQLNQFCHELVDYPAQGFVFEIADSHSIEDVSRSVVNLTDLLMDNKIAHNVFITRGSPLSDASSEELSAVRIYVWARKSEFGIKDTHDLNVAVCELAGFIPVKG